MRGTFRVVVLSAASAAMGWSQNGDNAELRKLFDEDQADRTSVSEIDWSKVAPRDALRRSQVRELLDKGKVVTGKDYERAAFVFQHGEVPDDFLFAHILAVTAIGKGNLGARWIAAATLDRFLQKSGHAQAFGTQFSNPAGSGTGQWTMEPYNRTLVSPSLRAANCVPDEEDQAAMLLAWSKGEDPKPPKRPPCPAKK